MKTIIASILILFSTSAFAQIESISVRIGGGISVPQRTEQPGLGKQALAGTGWETNAIMYMRSTSFNKGGLILATSYGEYNAENRYGITYLHLLAVEAGAYAIIPVYTEHILVNGSFGKAFQYGINTTNGFGGSLSLSYETAGTYSIYTRWSYYDTGANTIGLLKAGIAYTIF